MIEDFPVDVEVNMPIDVLQEFQKNPDMEYKYNYRGNKRYKRTTVDRHGFDNPEDLEDDDYLF